MRNHESFHRDTDRTELLRLCETLTDLMLEGRLEEAQQLIADHPEHAVELNSVLPAICMVHDVKSSGGDSVAANPPYSGSDPPLTEEGRLGDFQIVREIGRGGMGVVYEAEQLLLGRRVALKVLPMAGLLDERQRIRFQNEARAAATLSHPGIVPIYFVGVERGIHYFAMQYVTGQSLARVLDTLRSEKASTATTHHATTHDATTHAELQADLSTLPERGHRDKFYRAVAKVGLDAADALQHAHEHGIIHRDVKPSNLMLNESGQCVVTDFGLARLEDESQLTLTGDVIGTLRYAAPEQLLGEPCRVDHSADLYALGATLYELLSLQPARQGKSREQLLQQALESEPTKLRKLDATIPLDLETIIHKAMAREPEDRYESARQLGEDLRRFLDSKPILSQRERPTKRLYRWGRRHPRAVASSIAGLLAFATLLTLALVAVNQQRKEANRQRDTAIQNLHLAMSALDEAYLEFGSQWIDRDQDLSYMQQGFLESTAQLFGEIARRIPDEPRYFGDKGLAYQHSAKAAARLHQFSKAVEHYERACSYFAQSVAAAPDDLRVRQTYSKAAYDHGVLLRSIWQLDESLAALDVAEEQGRELLRQNPDDESMILGMALIDLARLEQSELEQQRDEVLRGGAALHRKLQQLLAKSPRNADFHLTELRLICLVARTLRQVDRADNALLQLRGALDQSDGLLHDFQDNRKVVRVQAEAIAERGRCEQELDNHEAAEQSLRESLARLRKSFLFDGTPKEYSTAYRNQEADAVELEPAAYAQYALTQASLAEVLLATGKAEQAYVVADEATRTCLMLASLFPEVPEYVAITVKCALVLRQSKSSQDEAIAAKVRLLDKVRGLLERDTTSRQPPPNYKTLFHTFQSES